MAARWPDPAPTWSARWLDTALGTLPAPTVPEGPIDWSDPTAQFWYGSPTRVVFPPRTEELGEDRRDAEPESWKVDRALDRYEAQFYRD